MKKHRAADSVIMLTALFLIGAAGLIYNFAAAESGDIAVSISDIIDFEETEASLVCSCAEANLMNREVIAVAAETVPVSREVRELLPPVVVKY